MPARELKHLGIMSVAAISAILGALWGIILGAIIAIVGKVTIPGLNVVVAGGLATLILVSLSAFIWTIVGSISALMYNFVARWISGIEVEVE